jgi:hypothetical protein
MKTFKLFLFIFAFLINLPSFCQVSVTGTAYTEIVPLATVKETVQFNSGRFSILSDGGAITITPKGARIVNGSVILLDGPFTQGGFTISGSENNSLSVILPNTPQLLYHSNSINTIYLDKWTYEIALRSKGYVLINVGATLNFRSLELNPAGIYTGKYQIVFLYN